MVLSRPNLSHGMCVLSDCHLSQKINIRVWWITVGKRVAVVSSKLL